MGANNITNEPYWVILSCRQSFCHTVTLLTWWISHRGMKLFKVWLDCATQPKKVIISLSLSPSLSSFCARSEPLGPQQTPSAVGEQACVVLSSSDSEPELSRGKARAQESHKGKQSGGEEEEDEPPKDKQKPGEAEEEDKRWLKGKQSAGERGDNIAGGGSCLLPDHTPGNPTCNLLLFISREIGWRCVVTCSYTAV